MLDINGVSKTYGKSKAKAVDNINLQVKKGEIFGFLGPNGAGKTTMIKMIVGLLQPDCGEITAGGINVWQNPIEAKKIISYVPDNPQIYTKLRGIEYLNFIADVYKISKQDREERIKKYTEIFEINNALNDIIESYSHGMQQKLILTSALIHEPELMILDEPMVGLDPKASFSLKEIMKEYCAKGKCIFFSTHVLEVAERICDRVAIINKGKLIAVGSVQELRQKLGEDDSLEEIFLEITKS